MQDSVNISRLKLVHGLEPGEVHGFCLSKSQPAYRATQIWQGLYRQHAQTWADIKGISSGLRQLLIENFSIDSAVEVAADGENGGTRKLLVGLPDGERVEEVLIPALDRYTVCISSQVGCKFACAFCASGQAGFKRNLEAGEIVGQVVLAARAAAGKLTNVVFMGIGEPFDNYDAVLKAVRIINNNDGLCIGARRITISTSGVIPGIERLLKEGLQVELSVSLHAPDDTLRSKLMPVNRKYPLAALISACKAYSAATNRIITFEYTLIRDVNDTQENAKALVALLRSFRCRVNLIPLSTVKEFEGRPSTPATGEMFIRMLNNAGINATLRASRGSGVSAACGQLRSRHAEK